MSTEEVVAVEQRPESGYAPVKPEYIKPKQSRDKLNLNFVSDLDRKKLTEAENEGQEAQNGQTTDEKDNPAKRGADENGDENKSKRSKKLHGMNKNRHNLMNNQNIRNVDERVKLCSKFSGSYGLQEIDNIEKCTREDCRFGHDVDAFMASNPVYLDEPCYMFERYGFCGNTLFNRL